jgi:hypothetical protein
MAVIKSGKININAKRKIKTNVIYFEDIRDGYKTKLSVTFLPIKNKLNFQIMNENNYRVLCKGEIPSD